MGRIDDLDEMSARLKELWERHGAPTPEIRDLVRRMVEEHPTEAWPWLALAEVHREDGADDEAASAIARAVAVAPDDEYVALSAAEELVSLGRLAEALEQLQRVERSGSPLSDRVVRGRVMGIQGRIRHREGHLHEAHQLLNGAVEILPEYEYHWWTLGAVLFDRGRLAQAEQVARRGLKRFPDDAALRSLLDHVQSVRTTDPRHGASGTSTGTRATLTWFRGRR